MTTLARTWESAESDTLSGSALSLSGIVGIYFGLRVCITFLLFRSDPQMGATVSVTLNLLLLLPVAFYAMGPARHFFEVTLHAWPVRFVLLYLALSLASISWGESRSIGVSAGYWSTLVADVLLVVALLYAQPEITTLRSLFKGYVCGVCILAIIAWSYPPLPDLRLGDLEFLNPNAIGYECAFAIFLCAYLVSDGLRWKLAGGILALTLLRSLSKTSIAAFIAAGAFYLVRGRIISRKNLLTIACVALLVLLAFVPLFQSYYTVYLNAGDQAETLTGRTAIWAVTAGLAVERPWTGHGFNSFRTVSPAFGSFEPWHAHNELLQQFFTFGVVGVVLMLLLYGSLYIQLRQLEFAKLRLLGLSLLILVLVRGLADTERFDLSFPLWAVTALSATIALTSEGRKRMIL